MTLAADPPQPFIPWQATRLSARRVLVLAALVVVPVLTLSWVLHNVGIYRRRGARRAVTPVNWSYDADFNGRRVAADWPDLTLARRVDVVIDGDTKRFIALLPHHGADRP